MFSREDYEIFKNTYFGEHLRLNILQNILQNISLLLLLYFYYLHASSSSFQYFSTSLYTLKILYKNQIYILAIVPFWRTLEIFIAWNFSFMARQCNLCPRASQGYKLRWKTINEKFQAINIYNEKQRLHY